jgi:hypothetical protein
VTIALLTQSLSLRALLDEQASGRGVLRLVSDKTLAKDRAFARAGIRLFCPDGTDERALADLRRAIPKARAYTRASYLRERQRFVESLRLDAFKLRSNLVDLLLVILCEMQESGHPVYLVIDDDEIPRMLALATMLNDLFELVSGRLNQETLEHAAVLLVPASACAPAATREASA